MQSQRNLLRILLISAAIFYLVFIFRTAFEVKGKTYFTLVDDAMISMRYARNLAQGNGLLWNPGQPPVEGFTNLGWTLLLAVLHLLPISPAHVSLVVMLLGAAILVCNILVVFKIVHAVDASARFAPIIAASMTAFYFPLVFWTLRGLEVGLVALAIGLAMLLCLRLSQDSPGIGAEKPRRANSFWLSLVLGVALLIRLDAVIAAGLILVYLASKAPRKATVPVLTALLVFAGILLFQKSYFGDLLPNTYYLKVNGVTAWERIRVGLLGLNDYASRDFFMPLLLGLMGLILYEDLRRPVILGLLALFLAQVGYSVWVGGDYVEELVDSANRFIAQGMPALIIFSSLALDRVIERSSGTGLRPALAMIIGLGALLVISGEPWIKWTFANAPMLRTDIQRTKLGLQINQFTKPEAVIAVHAAGQIPYFSERTTIDLLGKSDPVIAKGAPATAFAPGHNKWNYEYSIVQLRPDVIADNFNKLRGFMEDQPEYRLLPNGIYVRNDSTLVNIEGLAGDYH